MVLHGSSLGVSFAVGRRYVLVQLLPFGWFVIRQELTDSTAEPWFKVVSSGGHWGWLR